MKYDYNDIMEFFDNEMDETKYNEFFQNLASDEELLDDFVCHLRFKDAAAAQPKVYENTDELNRKILRSLGMSEDPWKEKTFFLIDWLKNKFLQGIVLGILGTILLLWGYYSFFAKESESKTPNPMTKVNNIPNTNANDLLAKNIALEEKTPNGIQSNSKIRIVHDTIFKEKMVDINKNDNPMSKNQKEIIDDIDSAKLTYQDNSKVYIDRSVNNYYINEDKNENLDKIESDTLELISSLAQPPVNEANIDKNATQMKENNIFKSLFSWLHNYQIELKRYKDFYTEPTKSEPSYYNEFNKFGLTVHYLFNEKFSAGLDLRQETTNINYRNLENNATVYQQLNLTTLSAEFRYNYFLTDNYWSLNGSLALGANIIGYNIRPTFGTNLYLSDYFYLNLNANYNFLYFRQYGTFHPASKYSIYYGIGVKL